jgi:hypothetical protein
MLVECVIALPAQFLNFLSSLRDARRELERMTLDSLKRLAPQAGFEPATLRLTGIHGDVISMVLQCLSSDWIIVIFGVRRVIVQRLFSAGESRGSNR